MTRTKARKPPAPEAHPEAGILYRIDGGEPIRAEDLDWAAVFPWHTMERKSPATPWMQTLPEPPLFLNDSPDHHPGPDGRYRLTGPVWPPAPYRSPR